MKRLAFGIILASLLTSVAFGQSKTAMSDLQELAVVKLNKREAITVRQVKARVDSYQKQTGTEISVADRARILDMMIQEKLISQAAQKAGVTVPDSQVDQYFLGLMAQVVGGNITEQQFATLVREQLKMSLDDYMREQVGMNVADYKAYLKTQLVAQQYVLSQKQNDLQRISATDEQIRAFYELNKSSFVQNDMLRLFVVDVPKGNNAQTAKTKANELLNGYKDKKQTADQLVVSSRAANSAFQAGEALINKSEQSAMQMGLSYQDLLTLFSRPIGWVSEMQDDTASYQFYAIMEKYDAKMLGLSDVVQPGTTITVYDYIRENLSQQQQMAFLQEAVGEIATGLDTAANVERKKVGNDLTVALSW